MQILSEDQLRPLPERPDIAAEEVRAAEVVQGSGGATSVTAARVVCAREYGFKGWEDLAAYFALCAAHERAGSSPYNLSEERANQEVQSLLKDFNSRKQMTEPPPDSMGFLAAAATYVPRLYGLSNEAMVPLTLTEAEAQLIVARQRRFMSWSALSAKIDDMRKYDAPEYQHPRQELKDAQRAVRERDIDGISRAFREHPDWFGDPEIAGMTFGLVWDAIKQAIDTPDSESRALLEHLKALSVDLQAHLDSALLGNPGTGSVSTTTIRGLLELGANVHSMPPSRYTVLEYAIVRYINGEAVDLIAQHVTPRRAFWIAAGLGDVETMLSFIDDSGRPTAEARAHRVDANAFALMPYLAHAPRPKASDLDILWEAFMLAGLNGRIPALEALLQRGFPVDYAPGPENMLVTSVRHALVDVVEYLLSRGADPNYKSWPNHWSARDAARVMMGEHEHPNAARIRALLQTTGISR